MVFFMAPLGHSAVARRTSRGPSHNFMRGIALVRDQLAFIAVASRALVVVMERLAFTAVANRTLLVVVVTQRPGERVSVVAFTRCLVGVLVDVTMAPAWRIVTVARCLIVAAVSGIRR